MENPGVIFMPSLLTVLYIKIAFTAVVWATPALLVPRKLILTLGYPEPKPLIFLRLLGGAYFALLVGYIQGAQSLQAGIYPATTVLVGIVSNGVAFLILAVGAVKGTWLDWGWAARLIMWISLAMTFLITVGLLYSGQMHR